MVGVGWQDETYQVDHHVSADLWLQARMAGAAAAVGLGLGADSRSFRCHRVRYPFVPA